MVGSRRAMRLHGHRSWFQLCWYSCLRPPAAGLPGAHSAFEVGRVMEERGRSALRLGRRDDFRRPDPTCAGPPAASKGTSSVYISIVSALSAVKIAGRFVQFEIGLVIATCAAWMGLEMVRPFFRWSLQDFVAQVLHSQSAGYEVLRATDDDAVDVLAGGLLPKPNLSPSALRVRKSKVCVSPRNHAVLHDMANARRCAASARGVPPWVDGSLGVLELQ